MQRGRGICAVYILKIKYLDNKSNESIMVRISHKEVQRLYTQGEAMNRFLVEVFNEILKTEEQALAASRPDLSLREFHLIEEV